MQALSLGNNFSVNILLLFPSVTLKLGINVVRRGHWDINHQN